MSDEGAPVLVTFPDNLMKAMEGRLRQTGGKQRLKPMIRAILAEELGVPHEEPRNFRPPTMESAIQDQQERRKKRMWIYLHGPIHGALKERAKTYEGRILPSQVMCDVIAKKLDVPFTPRMRPKPQPTGYEDPDP